MCNFSLPFTGNVDNLVTIAKKAVTGAGGTFNETATPSDPNSRSGNFFVSTSLGHVTGSYTGDLSSGNVTVSASVGHISASYQTDGVNLTVNISHLPLLVPCNSVRDQLAAILGNNTPN